MRATRPVLLLTLSLCFVGVSSPVVAQSDIFGKEFWFSFPQNARQGELKLENYVVVTAIEDASVTVTTTPHPTAAGRTYGVTLKKGEGTRIDLDSSSSCTASEVIENKGVHVTSTGRIGVTAVSRRPKSADTYRVMPVDRLGDRYMITGYYSPTTDAGFTSQFTVIATQDNTLLEIALTAMTRMGKPSGEKIGVVLKKGQTYTVQGVALPKPGSRSDLTGTVVSADKPIAVFTGHSCAQVPSNVMYCDVLIEQAQPRTRLGKEFIVPRLERRKGFSIRIIAAENNTTVKFGDEKITFETAGEYFDRDTDTLDLYITSDKPITVAQFAQGYDVDKIGDPFMMLVGPTTSFVMSTAFTVPVRGAFDHFITIVIPSKAAHTLKIDGNPIPATSSITVQGTEYSIVDASGESGSHIITADEPFGMYNYGFGFGVDNFDSYGTYCGGW